MLLKFAEKSLTNTKLALGKLREMQYVKQTHNTGNMYLFKVNTRNSRKRCEMCSELTSKTPK